MNKDRKNALKSYFLNFVEKNLWRKSMALSKSFIFSRFSISKDKQKAESASQPLLFL
jgi:hypothetical protein